MTSPRNVAVGVAYVRRSINPPGTMVVWQVRRNRPDQTFDVLSVHTKRSDAEIEAARVNSAGEDDLTPAELRALEESQWHRENDSQERAERNDRDNQRDREREEP